MVFYVEMPECCLAQSRIHRSRIVEKLQHTIGFFFRELDRRGFLYGFLGRFDGSFDQKLVHASS